MRKYIYLLLFGLLGLAGCSEDETFDETVFLQVTPNPLVFTDGEEEKSLLINTNAAWTIECKDGWVHPEALSGQDSVTLRVTVDPIEDYVSRETAIYVRSGEEVQAVIVKQAVESEWHEDGEVRLYREEDAGNPIKLVFMGDGFTKADLFVGGNYDRVLEEAIDAYLDVEPFKSYRKYFCPYIVYACSNERGCGTLNRYDENRVNETKDTRFKTMIQDGSTLMQGDHALVREYAKKVEGVDVAALEKTPIVVIANDPRRAGTCWMSGRSQSIAYIPVNRDDFSVDKGGFEHIVIHEGAGHGFGLLADEYATGGDRIPADQLRELQNHQALGRFMNVVSDKEKAPWKDFIGRSGYERVDYVEGGFLYKRGVWRSEEHCCMIDNIFYFNVASRLAIVKRIKAIAGETFDLEDFIAKDVQKKPTQGQLIGSRSVDGAYWLGSTPPRFIEE